MKEGDLVTDTDRSYLRSIYRHAGVKGASVCLQFVSYNGFPGKGFIDVSAATFKDEYRLATPEEVVLSGRQDYTPEQIRGMLAISDEELLRRAQRITPYVNKVDKLFYNQALHYLVELDFDRMNLAFLKDVPYLESPMYGRLVVGNFRKQATITTYHSGVLFAPKIAEVLAQIPDEYAWCEYFYLKTSFVPDQREYNYTWTQVCLYGLGDHTLV